MFAVEEVAKPPSYLFCDLWTPSDLMNASEKNAAGVVGKRYSPAPSTCDAGPQIAKYKKLF